jgi:hypothetical protein
MRHVILDNVKRQATHLVQIAAMKKVVSLAVVVDIRYHGVVGAVHRAGVDATSSNAAKLFLKIVSTTGRTRGSVRRAATQVLYQHVESFFILLNTLKMEERLVLVMLALLSHALALGSVQPKTVNTLGKHGAHVLHVTMTVTGQIKQEGWRLHSSQKMVEWLALLINNNLNHATFHSAYRTWTVNLNITSGPNVLNVSHMEKRYHPKQEISGLQVIQLVMVWLVQQKRLKLENAQEYHFVVWM